MHNTNHSPLRKWWRLWSSWERTWDPWRPGWGGPATGRGWCWTLWSSARSQPWPRDAARPEPRRCSVCERREVDPLDRRSPARNGTAACRLQHIYRISRAWYAWFYTGGWCIPAGYTTFIWYRYSVGISKRRSLMDGVFSRERERGGGRFIESLLCSLSRNLAGLIYCSVRIYRIHTFWVGIREYICCTGSLVMKYPSMR